MTAYLQVLLAHKPDLTIFKAVCYRIVPESVSSSMLGYNNNKGKKGEGEIVC